MKKLANLFATADKNPIAIRNGKPIHLEEFEHDVATNIHKLKNTRRATLICADSYNFTVGLFALLHAGATITLPSNTHAKFGDEILVNDNFIISNNNKTAKAFVIDEDKLSLEFFTSGSTGEPKRIVKNLRMLQNEIETIEKFWGDKTGGGPVFATVPHQHFYSLIFKILWPLATSRPFSNVMHGLWEELLPELDANSIIVSSPAHLERLGGIASKAKPSRIFSAGARLPFEAAQLIKKTFGITATEIFGSTETGAIATRQQIKGDEEWKPLPGITISADSDKALELISPFIGPEKYTTSDIIKITANGFDFLGRADRIVKIAGKRVSLPEVEQALNKLPSIHSAAVVYLADKERLAAAVVLNPAGQQQLQSLGNFRMGRVLREELLNSFEPASIPKLWRFIEELPKQALGKQRDSDIINLF